MYKIFENENNQIELQEHFKSPTIYLDHWALNIFAEDAGLRSRFVTLMNDKGGTFRLSVYNIVELSAQGDKSQVNAILDMIDNIHDCGLINVDPREVIRKENGLILNSSLRYNPSAELELIEAFLLAHNYPPKWHVSELISSVLPALSSKNRTQSNVAFVNDMNALLKAGRENSTHMTKASKRFKAYKNNGPEYQTATRELWQMTNDFIIRNKDMKMSTYGEWVDLFHVIVPVAYCNVVLIDKRWKTFIAQTGMSFPNIAKVFDNKSLEEFYHHIENWGNSADLTFK